MGILAYDLDTMTIRTPETLPRALARAPSITPTAAPPTRPSRFRRSAVYPRQVHNHRRLPRRRDADIHQACLTIGCALICDCHLKRPLAHSVRASNELALVLGLGATYR
jgi:hypothetical protein